MTRITFSRSIAAVGAALVAVATASCGNSDSTSTQRPSLSTLTASPSSSATATASPAASSASSSPSSTVASSSTTPASSASAPESGSTPTTSGPGGAVAVTDTSIRHHAFGDARFVTRYHGTVTLHDGTAPLANGASAALGGTASQVFKMVTPIAYGDLNHDGVEDAVVRFDILDGNSPWEELSVWLGAKGGSAKQLGKPFTSATDCGKFIHSFTITPAGEIQVTGSDGSATSCADASNGPRYVATYRVSGDAVQTLTPPPGGSD